MSSEGEGDSLERGNQGQHDSLDLRFERPRLADLLFGLDSSENNSLDVPIGHPVGSSASSMVSSSRSFLSDQSSEEDNLEGVNQRSLVVPDGFGVSPAPPSSPVRTGAGDFGGMTRVQGSTLVSSEVVAAINSLAASQDSGQNRRRGGPSRP